MKTPDECGGSEEIRAEIDRIDRSRMYWVLGERFRYVKAAARWLLRSA